ncbi:MAG: CopG family antitoxin [Rhodospirillales bacterium]
MSNGERRDALPNLETDEDAERFVAEANLNDYDLSNMTTIRFRFGVEPGLSVRLPTALLDAVRMKAKACGISYERFIREAIERALEDSP